MANKIAKVVKQASGNPTSGELGFLAQQAYAEARGIATLNGHITGNPVVKIIVEQEFIPNG